MKINFTKEFAKLNITRGEFLAKARMSWHTLNRLETNPAASRPFSMQRALSALVHFKKEKAKYDRLNNK